MNIARTRPFGQTYAFVVIGIIFLVLLIAAARASTPGVLILPLEQSFGWRRDVISLAAAISICLYGLAGPFAAALMDSIGIRRTVLGVLVAMAGATAASTWMTEPWHLIVTWGVIAGTASGGAAMVLGATVVNRWFTTNRGLVMGLLTASTATGTLIFLPLLASLVQTGGWQPAVWTVAIALAALIPLVYFFVPERPADIGLIPYGATTATNSVPPHPAPAQNLFASAFGSLARASKTRAFWYLFGTFFICGFTTNGLVGTHMIALCGDRGISEVQAAGLLAMMGVFDLIGTTLSGWLTDRFDPRKLLFIYYALRGLSLIYLPYSDFSLYSLSIFAMFYGLDWIATVPPTLKITNDVFGDREAPKIFGWIFTGHQLGAASAAFFAGYVRETQGDYFNAFIIAGCTGLLAAGLSLLISRRRALAPA